MAETIRPAEIDFILKALKGDFNEDQQLIAEEGIRWLTVLIKKNMDYGSSVFHPPVLKPSLKSGDAILVRASDKVRRLEQLHASNQNHVGESIEDTVRDLGAYCLLWLCNPNRDK